MKLLLFLTLLLIAMGRLSAGADDSESTVIADAVLREAMHGKNGTLVVIQCSSGKISDIDPPVSAKGLPPCSTFKIWNALFAIEAGLISEPEEAFYKWDGVERGIPAWNRDLTL